MVRILHKKVPYTLSVPNIPPCQRNLARMESEMPKVRVKIAPDSLNNPKKMNDTLATLEYNKSADTVMSYPRNVVFAVTDACNQRCRFCNGSQKSAGEAAYADPRIFARMNWLKYCNEIQVSGSGEALCHPAIGRILRGIRSVAECADLRLYTNGLALNGQRLDIALDTCNSIHISANAVTREVYDHVIRQGSYDTLVSNLDELARRKPPHVRVMLSVVVLRETVHEIRKLVDFAAERGFDWVVAILGMQNRAVLERGGLPAESFDVTYTDYLDVEGLKEYARQRKILLVLEQRFSAFPESLDCNDPWTHLRLLTLPRKERGRGAMTWRAQVCCANTPNLHVSDDALVDGHQLWNCGRLRLIRRTVNNECLQITSRTAGTEDVPANPMCAYCRMAREIGLNDSKGLQELRAALHLPGQDFFPLAEVGNPPAAQPE